MPASIAFKVTPCKAGGFLGGDQEHVHTLTDEILDVGNLFLGLVLTIGDQKLDLRVMVGFPLHVLVELDAPRLERCRLREADANFFACANTDPSGEAATRRPAAVVFRNVLRSMVSSDGRDLVVSLWLMTVDPWSCLLFGLGMVRETCLCRRRREPDGGRGGASSACDVWIAFDPSRLLRLRRSPSERSCSSTAARMMPPFRTSCVLLSMLLS